MSLEKSLASSSTEGSVQSAIKVEAASEISYEARGGGGSNPSRRTNKAMIKSYFPDAVFPMPEELLEDVQFYVENRRELQVNPKTRRASLKKRMLLHKLWLAADRTCYVCGKKTPFSRTTRDHVFPSSLGFRDHDNIMPACGPCNRVKSNKMPTEEQVCRSLQAYLNCGKRFRPQKKKTSIETFFLEIVLKSLEKRYV